MKCYVCNEELIWGGDHDLEDVEEHTIITNLMTKCRVYHGNEQTD